MKFYPYKKWGGGIKSVSHAEGCFEVVLTWELGVLPILMGGCKKFQPFRGGGGTKRFTLF